MISPSSHNPNPPKKGGHSLLFIVILVVVFVVAGGGIFMRVKQGWTLSRNTEENAIPSVTVIKAAQGPATEDIVLPGNVMAWHEAPIYARTSGYLKDWKTDIGAAVKAGDILAEIETPEVDAQLQQAQADLATAKANNDLAQSTADRWAGLLKTNAVSTQDAADKAGAAAASVAAMAAAQANVDRLQQLEGFKRILAPFDGVITARNTDRGALINAGSGGTGLELFHISETDKLRAYVQVPQLYAAAIKPDLAAELHFAEHPGKTFPAKLTNSADALDPSTRTLLIQLEVDNAENALLPGGYAEVHLKIPASGVSVHLPVNTLMFRAKGLQVATIDKDGKAMLKSIVIGRDYGTEVEVKSGIAPGETIIINPPDSLATGEPVRIATPGKNGDDGEDGDAKKQ